MMAITALEDAGQTVAIPGTDSYVGFNYTLGLALDYRYSLHSDPKDLEQAIAAYRLAADTTPWADRKLFYTSKKPPTASTTWGLPWCSRASGTTGLEQLRGQPANSTARRAVAWVVPMPCGRWLSTHYLMGNYDKARVYFRDALRIYQAEENLKGEATSRAGLGRLMLRLNFVDDAISELNKACALYRTLGDETRLKELQEVYTLAQKVKEKQPL
jgi:tetratricopeptide (TPR) repeat protein